MTSLPVFGVPVESKALSGQDSLLSIVQMPAGIPVGTLAIGKAGAVNAALLAASVLSLSDAGLAGGSTPGARRRPQTWPSARRTRHDDLLNRSCRLDHRHIGRRSARPHAGARRRTPRHRNATSMRPKPTAPPSPVSAARTVASYDDFAALEGLRRQGRRRHLRIRERARRYRRLPRCPAWPWRRASPPSGPRRTVIAEKTFIAGLGIPVAPFAEVSDLASLEARRQLIGSPAVLKTRRFGYDGKGQVRSRRHRSCRRPGPTSATSPPSSKASSGSTRRSPSSPRGAGRARSRSMTCRRITTRTTS
jgi:hypothetical protein